MLPASRLAEQRAAGTRCGRMGYDHSSSSIAYSSSSMPCTGSVPCHHDTSPMPCDAIDPCHCRQPASLTPCTAVQLTVMRYGLVFFVSSPSVTMLALAPGGPGPPTAALCTGPGSGSSKMSSSTVSRIGSPASRYMRSSGDESSGSAATSGEASKSQNHACSA